MSDILTTLTTTDWSALYAALMTIYGIISTIFAGVQTRLKNLFKKQGEEDLQNANDLMNPNKETTDAQKQLIIDGKITGGAWKMNATTCTELYDRLTEAGAEISRDALNSVIDQAEKDCNVEYVIRCFSYKKGTSIDEDPAAFISYGSILKIADWTTIKAIAADHKETDFYSIS